MVERFERFSHAIFEISRCWHKLADHEMAKYDLKGPYAVYLMTMRRHEDGLTAAQLAETCGRDKADVSRAIAQLEEKGLVCRQGSLYRARLHLTQEGQNAAEQVCHRIAVAVELAGKGFNQENRDIFYSVLEMITRNLRMMCREGLPE